MLWWQLAWKFTMKRSASGLCMVACDFLQMMLMIICWLWWVIWCAWQKTSVLCRPLLWLDCLRTYTYLITYLLRLLMHWIWYPSSSNYCCCDLKKSRQKPWDTNYVDIRLLNQPSFDVCENNMSMVARTDRNWRQISGGASVPAVASGVSVDNLRLGG